MSSHVVLYLERTSCVTSQSTSRNLNKMTQKVKAGRDRNLGYDYSNPPLADCQNVPGISVGCGELGEGLVRLYSVS
jgi:hypothetical protein